MRSLRVKIDPCRSVVLPLLIFASALLATRAAAADGEFRALLVGVSAYDHPLSFTPLRGPANDVALIEAMLLRRGFSKQNIVMLADRAGTDGRPTREAILSELDRFAEAAEPNDTILIHLAGHGSQQPNNNPDEDRELDGLDEIFLPADAGLWVDELGTVSRAIVDDEIGERVTAIRRKGAFVFFASDSCHAETLTRAGVPVEQGVPVKERSRYVKPEQLGIPKHRLEEASAQASRSRGGNQETVPLDAPGGDPEGGGFVAFYAAQATEEAPEMPLPPGVIDADEKWYGLFSFHLASVLEAHPGITYRQALEQILQNYRADNRFGPTPIGEGPDLDRLVFGSALGAEARQWPIATEGIEATIPAGRLHRVSVGTIVAIAPAAATVEEAEFLGYARVANAGLLRSSIEPVAYRDRPAPAEIPAGAFARVVDAQFRMGLAVALGKRPRAFAAEAAAWREIDRLRGEGLDHVEIEWLAEDAPSADLRLLVRDGRLWFLPPSGELVTEGPARTPALTIPGDAAADEETLGRFRKDFEDNLRKVARVTTLFALARELAGNELMRSLEIKLEVKRGGTGEPEDFRLIDVPELRDGDELTFKVTNAGTRPIDLTSLFVDSRYRIEPWFPYGGEVNRVRPGETVSSKLVINLETVGIEHWIFIAAAVEPATLRTDFSFLAQEGLVHRRPTGSRVPTGPATILDLLFGAGLPDAAVRGGGRPPVALAGAVSFSWNVVADAAK